jgi:hypothetical protein
MLHTYFAMQGDHDRWLESGKPSDDTPLDWASVRGEYYHNLDVAKQAALDYFRDLEWAAWHDDEPFPDGQWHLTKEPSSDSEIQIWQWRDSEGETHVWLTAREIRAEDEPTSQEAA